MDLALDEATCGDATVLRVGGDIDLNSAPELSERIEDIHTRGITALIVDLGGVAFLDSSAIGVLVRAHRTLRDAGGGITIVSPRPAITNVFRIARLDEVMPVLSSLDHH